MLDYFGIFTRGGALLWTLQFTALRHGAIEALNALIRTCLLEERSGDNTFTYVPKTGAHQALKWTYHNGLGLVFVAVYQRTLSLMYVDELLQRVKAEFTTSHYKPGQYDNKAFNDAFTRLLRDCEAKAEEARRPAQMRAGPPAAAKGGKVANGKAGSKGGKGSKAAAAAECNDEDDDSASDNQQSQSEEQNTDVGGDESANGSSPCDTADEDAKAFDVSKLKAGGPRAGGRGVRGRGVRPSSGPLDSKAGGKEDVKKDTAPKKKAMRNWNLMKGEEDLGKLDFSTEDGGAAPHSGYISGVSDGEGGPVSGPLPGLGFSRMDQEDDEVVEEDEEEVEGPVASKSSGSKGQGPAKRGLLGSFMNSLAMNVVGKGALAAEDLEPALADMKKKLMERNVAEEIAQAVCDSVGRSLEGQKLSSFTGVGAFVRQAFEDALSGILNKRQVDVLLDIQKAKARGRPYVIVFCGVNGVGKSTNLAKIAYWLGQHNIKVMIAACDTFRAGAVEQLKTHCTRLGVPLYERGYEKDPAKVAYEAIKQAERGGRDVVLVDTAGRMQDNEPLMRALANLINVNEPNLVLFVGEALVGNDAVDQLVKFNRALYDLAPPTARTKRTIDGIVLTKFDTIDDKVGAALSMVYSSGAPVMFVGCGQTYVDLKKLNVKSVVRSLLK